MAPAEALRRGVVAIRERRSVRSALCASAEAGKSGYSRKVLRTLLAAALLACGWMAAASAQRNDAFLASRDHEAINNSDRAGV